MKLIHIFFLFGLMILPITYSYAKESPPKRSIKLVIRPDFRGEHEFSKRINVACKNLNWHSEIVEVSATDNTEQYYDWILTLVPEKISTSKKKDYLVLFDPEHHFFDPDGHLNNDYLNYAGYLTTFKNTELLEHSVNSKRLYRQWYPTVQFRQYKEVAPNHLFYFLGHWGERYDSIRYLTLQEKLAQKSYTNLYGDPSIGQAYGNAFQGAIPWDGISVLDRISESGVCLVLHSNTHIQHQIPSGRIFEAAAASAVIISDLNPFVMEHFGDSVFYVDQTLSGEELFDQIDAHMTWIQDHPEEALEMARGSYQVFIEKFQLENQLLDFDKFHWSRR